MSGGVHPGLGPLGGDVPVLGMALARAERHRRQSCLPFETRTCRLSSARGVGARGYRSYCHLPCPCARSLPDSHLPRSREAASRPLRAPSRRRAPPSMGCCLRTRSSSPRARTDSQRAHRRRSPQSARSPEPAGTSTARSLAPSSRESGAALGPVRAHPAPGPRTLRCLTQDPLW